MPHTDFTITRSSRRTLALSVLPDGTIEVKAPYLMPKFFINQFINKNADWIDKRKLQMQHHRKLEKTYQHGEKYLYLGKEYYLYFGNFSTIALQDDKLLFPKALAFRIQKELENWYIRQAKELITKQADFFAQEMATSYKTITFSDTKSQWGRCTHDNRLQFSWRLIMAPLLVLNYVVIHELAHTTEKNHSIAFWRIVRRFTPSYRQQIKWLKTHGNSLVI